MHSKKPHQSIKEVLSIAYNLLKEHNIYSYRLDADVLLSHILGYDKVQLVTKQEQHLSAEQLKLYHNLLLRRCKKEPIAYIIEKKEFFGIDIFVNNHVLIPRPETEFIIEYVLHYKGVKSSILDIGCGSGIIPITIKKHIPSITLTGCDISSEALEVAKSNASSIIPDLDIQWVISNVFDNINDKYNIIISNPPYIPTSDINTLQEDVKNYEPHLALDGGNDGMSFYLNIAQNSNNHLEKDGIIILEIGINQKSLIEKIFSNYDFMLVDVIKDYSGIERDLVFSLK